ncbi:HEAT repeat-containing protein 6 [Camponotus floridanus]|uniref:HEAT repeat-containing protein 6 n=1 Tax=Camponotus floridanus TaxID=104421 RepID=E2AM02_CAMFO|nr:HEAT repeat-containing protein 6 [Camponotus floridanus]
MHTLSDLNELDYRCLNIINNDAILLLVNQLCVIILPTETSLVRNACKFLYNLTQNNIKLHGRTFATCKRWILEALEFSDPLAQVDVLIAIKSFLHAGYFDDINHIIHLCLHILHCIILEKLIPNSSDIVGEILGVVQAFLFHGIKGYNVTKPELLHPAAMNLPERIHIVPKCKNLKNYKAKLKKTPTKKSVSDIENSTLPEHTGISKYSSDSDTSDTEFNNSVHIDSKVRLEAVHLLQTLMEISQSREIFGYWPQIVATGSRNDARVLTRSILMEPISKVRQNVLSTLTELLISARPFLIHAEETDHTSFITFFGTVCLMIKELHFTLSLILFTEKNVTVLTHALKCTAALVQGTPYERLKPGLATKLVRNCRSHIFHKDPTVRVAALSIFEAFASSEPITQEILNILAKQSIGGTELGKLQLDSGSISDVGTEEEEIDIEDLNNSVDNCTEIKTSKDESVCLLIRVCLENISNKIISTPVRLQSLKLMGRLAFNTGSLIFPHLEKVTTILISVMEESESQVILHACRVLEIMSGCLANIETYHSDGILFWNIIFDSMISLAQTSQTILREAACDCLGSISGNVFTQLSRQKTILIITILFGAVRDEESAVRAAGLRALGIQHEEIEPFSLEVLLAKLYHISVKAAKDNDKVRWNACRALGLVLSHNPDAILPSSWKDEVFPALSTLICNSPNFKVRTNAAWALYSCNYYGKYTIMLWKSIVLAFENAQHVPSFVEYPHRDALIQQLCLTLARVAACTEKSELQSLWLEIGDHVEEISNVVKQFQETVLPEKLGDLIKAKAQLEQLTKSTCCIEDQQIAQSLTNIFERNRYDYFDVITPTI